MMGILKRNGKWLAVVELGFDAAGRRRRKYATCTSEAEAKRVYATLAAEVYSGTYVEPSSETAAEFLTEWLAHATRGRRQSTADAYRITVERHLIPALGSVRLSDLKPIHIERFMTAQLGKGLSPATVDKHFWTLHKALDRAVAWGRLMRSPADAVEKPGQQELEVRSFALSEQVLLLGRSAGTWLHGVVLVAMATGMRRGELCALRWQNVDLEALIVEVRGSASESSAGVCLGSTKTTASTRRVRIPESVAAFLAEHRERQKQLYSAISTYHDRGFVFPRQDGEMRRPSTVTAAFARLCVEAGVEGAHFHCLRHTFATEMLAAGVPVKVVSEMLGHASVATTLRIYAHVLETMQEQAAVTAGQLVERALRLE